MDQRCPRSPHSSSPPPPPPPPLSCRERKMIEILKCILDQFLEFLYTLSTVCMVYLGFCLVLLVPMVLVVCLCITLAHFLVYLGMGVASAVYKALCVMQELLQACLWMNYLLMVYMMNTCKTWAQLPVGFWVAMTLAMYLCLKGAQMLGRRLQVVAPVATGVAVGEGLSTAELERLGGEGNSGKVARQECVVCLEDQGGAGVEATCVLPQCRHAFRRDTIDRWLQLHPDYPAA